MERATHGIKPFLNGHLSTQRFFSFIKTYILLLFM